MRLHLQVLSVLQEAALLQGSGGASALTLRGWFQS
jgi:hypothetical protein